MPELPEIEALRELLDADYADREVVDVTVRQFALVKTFDPPMAALVGMTLSGARRQGKHLLIDFGGSLTVALHLGIGGRLVPGAPGSKAGRSASLDLAFADGSFLRVVELGTKKRSSVHLLGADAVAAHLQGLGVDALSPDLTVERLGEQLAADRRQLKTFLEDQREIAGIGNAYSDEILWEGWLPPLKLTTSLSPEETAGLHGAIRDVLGAAIERARADSYLLVARGDERHEFRVHRRQGDPCPRCGGAIASIYYAESSLQYCPGCQNEGRIYADRRLSRLFK